MKKILIVHNKYRHLGGEDIAVEREISFLKKDMTLSYYFLKTLQKIFYLNFFLFLITKITRASNY